MAEEKSLFAGIDIGGTSVKVGLFTGEGELLGRAAVPTPPLVDDAGYAAVTTAIERAAEEAGESVGRIAGIGLAVPCPVPDDGCITLKANIQIEPEGLAAALAAYVPGATVAFANDANAATLGELWRGAARGRSSLVMATIGTGVGGGVVVDGDIVAGANGAGGEIGHMCLNPIEERTCGCGGHGCLEQYASATGIVNSYLAACERTGTTPVELSGPSDTRSVFEALKAGDEAARYAVDTMCDYLGRALAILACVSDPQVFLIGGGVCAGADLFLDQLRERYRRYALSVTVDTPIEVASLGNDAGMVGAAYLAMRSQ